MALSVYVYMAQVLCSLSVFTFSTIRVNVFLAGFACPCMVAAVLCVHLYLIQYNMDTLFRICLWEGLGWLVDKCQFIILQLPPILHLICKGWGVGNGRTNINL